MQYDVTQADQVEAIFQSMVESCGRLDYALEGVRMRKMTSGAIQSTMTRYVMNRIFQFKLVRNRIQQMMQPLGRIGEPEKVGEAAMWLSPEAASLSKGKCMVDRSRSASFMKN